MVELLPIAAAGLATLLALHWGPTAYRHVRYFFSYPSYGTSPLCPHCLAAIGVSQHFCRECKQPVSGFAATDPILSIAAQGCVFRGAVRRPSAAAVIGLWFLAAPYVATAVIERLKGDRLTSASALLFSLPWLALASKATHAFISAQSRESPA